MKRATGFTLIELLVVIAIISILAGIIIPNVSKYISKARGTKAVAEINGIDLALTAMLADAGRNNFADFFTPTDVNSPLLKTTSVLTLADVSEAVQIYTNAFYVLLKKGKNSAGDLANYGLILNDSIRRKLSDGYMTDLGKDPWGTNLYQFFAGPWYGGTTNPIPFVIRQLSDDIPGGPGPSPLYHVAYTTTNGDPEEMGWNPQVNLPVYVFSKGANLRTNQPFGEHGTAADLDAYKGTSSDLGDDAVGGGDDVNNWDKEASWTTFY